MRIILGIGLTVTLIFCYNEMPLGEGAPPYTPIKNYIKVGTDIIGDTYALYDEYPNNMEVNLTAIAIPWLPHVAIKGAKLFEAEITTLLRRGHMPSTELIRSSAKVIPGVEHEAVAYGVTSFEAFAQARQAAKDFAGLGDETIDFIQQRGPNRGRITGRQSIDELRGWRLDFDPKNPNKGFHINWWDRTPNPKDRTAWLYGSIHITGGTEEQLLEILAHFPIR